MTPTGRTLALLRAEGYVCCVAEAWLPHVHRRRDLFGFADVAAVHPHVAGPLLVQVTTAGHLADRGRKVRASAAARLWIRAGGRVELHGWQRRAGRWTVRRVQLYGEDLLASDLTPRPKRRGRQRGLFDNLAPKGATDGNRAQVEAKREAVAVALASGKTAKAAAAECGVGERTVGLWMADDAFRRRVGELRGEMVARAAGKMANGMSAAADQLRRLLKAKSESVRLAAARAVLELGTKLRESGELEERLTDLERRIKRAGGK